jgi:type III pantothenate kinase
MILCDIGNTFYHFYEKGRIWKTPSNQKPELTLNNKKLYYISVNEYAENRLLDNYTAINLDKYTDLDTNYRGLGIDRAVASLAIEDGVIVDAGSAITVDIMQSGMHLGGYIIPGLNSYQKMYGKISKELEKNICFDISENILPQNTADAISYGIIMPIINTIKLTAKNKRILFTGGDGAHLSRYFPNSIVDNSLIFKGMMKIIKEKL